MFFFLRYVIHNTKERRVSNICPDRMIFHKKNLYRHTCILLHGTLAIHHKNYMLEPFDAKKELTRKIGEKKNETGILEKRTLTNG